MKEYTYTNKAYLGIKEGVVPPAPQYLWLNSKDNKLYKFGDNGWVSISGAEFSVMGEYDKEKTYYPNSIVTYNGSSFISLISVPTYEYPTQNSDYWNLLAQKGEQGPQGNSGYSGNIDELEVVNNLIDGGENSALSAEQGKILKEELNECVTPIEVTQIIGENTLSALDETSNKPVDSKGIAEAIKAASKVNDLKITKLEQKVSLIRGNTSDTVDIASLNNGTELIIYSDYAPTSIYIDSNEGRTLVGVIKELTPFGGLFSYTKKEGDLSVFIWQNGENYNRWVTDAPTLIKILNEINNKVEISLSPNLADPSKVTIGRYIYSETGELGHSSNFNVTDYIHCKPDTTYYKAKDSSSEFTRCLCYDGDKKPIADSYNSSAGTSYTTAPNAVYMRLTYFASAQDVLQVSESQEMNYVPYSPIGGYLIDLYDKFNNSNDFFSIFDNWGFIGDSLTSGYLGVPDVNGESPLSDVKGGIGRNIYRLSWGQILCKEYGVRGTNFSLGGMTARNWVLNYPIRKYNGYSNETKEYEVDFSSDIKTSYTICLGTNDVLDETTNPLGSISDIDLTNKDNNADSFYGNYAKIIQYCRELCPSCKIFLITPMQEWSAEAETRGYNNAVREICQLFDNCYLIDLAKSKVFVQEQYNYGAHPTSIGYAFVADLIKRAINDIVANNMEDFIFQGAIESLKNGYDDGNY